MLPSRQVSVGQSGLSQMYIVNSAPDAANMQFIRRIRKYERRKPCGDCCAYSPHEIECAD
jgi:hypothetical protein